MIRLENEIRKAQANKEVIIAVFLDIEKAYDMMWKEGVLIKLHRMRVGGRVFNWVKDFLFGWKIQVRIGSEVSNQYTVVNGTPQGSDFSPLLFIIMINDIFFKLLADLGRLLFVDDGALWRNVEFIVRKIKEAVDEVIKLGLGMQILSGKNPNGNFYQ